MQEIMKRKEKKNYIGKEALHH